MRYKYSLLSVCLFVWAASTWAQTRPLKRPAWEQ